MAAPRSSARMGKVSSVPRTYRGASAEERRARRRAMLLEGGLELLGTEGLARTTVRGICARAGLTDRYFYENFADRDALILTVFDDLAAQGIRSVLAAAAAAPREAHAQARTGVEAAVAFLVDDPRRGRVLLLEAHASEPLQRRRHETLRLAARVLSDQARAFFGPAALPEKDMELTALTLVGGMVELLSTWLNGELAVSREHLADFLVALLITMAKFSPALEQNRVALTRPSGHPSNPKPSR
jgi:AcrR family transcriptional regulator